MESIHLVIGADGQIGSALFRRLQSAGESVIGTTRRHANVNERCLHLDLANRMDEWKPPRPVNVATICAGVTTVQACKSNAVSATAVNVEGISNLVTNLVAGGAFVILLSTNQVFDGSIASQGPDAPLTPMTEYGRQKAEAERRMAQHGDSIAIVRFAKVFGAQPSLISGWADSLRHGKSIRAFSDMSLAPIPLSCAVTVLTLVAGLRLSGVLQVSAKEDISYADAARIGTKALGADPGLVQPVTAADSGSYADHVPAHTTMNIDRLKATLGIVPPDVRWTVEMAFTHPQLLAGS